MSFFRSWSLLLPAYDVTVEILWAMVAVLIGLTLLLFVTSLLARIRHWSYEQLVLSYQNKHYPLILGYLMGDKTQNEIEGAFLGKGIEFLVFEEIIFEILENLDGEDAEKLRQLLFLSPIYEFHFGQLADSDPIECIKACNYFSYIHLVNDEVIKRLVSLLESENKMLVFSAASALMASDEVKIRRRALKKIACQPHYSRMALLEMVYNFQYRKENQMNVEAETLRALITDPKISRENVAALIEGAIELGYMQLRPFLLQKLKSTESKWRHPKVLKVLIKAQGAFYNWDAVQVIKSFVYHHDLEVRIAVAKALGNFNDNECLECVYELLHDPEYRVRVAAAKSLHENNNGQIWLKRSYKKEHLNTQYIIDSL